MLYRHFRFNGELTDRVDGTEGEEFSVPDAVAIAEVAELLGVATEAVSVERGARSMHAAAEIVLAPTPPPPPERSPFALLLDVLASDKSLSIESQQAIADLVTKE